MSKEGVCVCVRPFVCRRVCVCVCACLCACNYYFIISVYDLGNYYFIISVYDLGFRSGIPHRFKGFWCTDLKASVAFCWV